MVIQKGVCINFHLLIYQSPHILIRLALHLIRDQQSAEIMLWDLGILLVPYLLPQFSTCHNPSQPLPVREKDKQEGRKRGRRKEEKRESPRNIGQGRNITKTKHLGQHMGSSNIKNFTVYVLVYFCNLITCK